MHCDPKLLGLLDSDNLLSKYIFFCNYILPAKHHLPVALANTTKNIISSSTKIAATIPIIVPAPSSMTKKKTKVISYKYTVWDYIRIANYKLIWKKKQLVLLKIQYKENVTYSNWLMNF